MCQALQVYNDYLCFYSSCLVGDLFWFQVKEAHYSQLNNTAVSGEGMREQDYENTNNGS